MEPAKVEVVKNTKKKSSLSPYLVDEPVKDSCGCLIQTLSPKCSHKYGGLWVVNLDGFFYQFVDGGDKDKDLWLDAAGIKNTDVRIKLLRWFCSECVNVQEP